MPTIRVRTTSVIEPIIRISFGPLSIILTPKLASRSLRDSQNPTVWSETATALAVAKMMPIAAPNSGPKDLDIM